VASSQDEEKVKLRWRGEETVQLPWLNVVLSKGDVVEVPRSQVHVEGDPVGEGFHFPPETWSFVGEEPRKKAASKAASDKSETPKAGE
jgi:hypothetical protein